MNRKTSGLIAGALLLAWAIPATAGKDQAPGQAFSMPVLAATVEALTARVNQLEEDNAALQRTAEMLAENVAYLLATDVKRSSSLACIDETQSNGDVLVLRGCDLHMQKDSGRGGSLLVHEVSGPDDDSLLVRAPESLLLISGSASVVLKKDGDISIKGKDIDIDASAGVDIKASNDVVIKGSKILEN